MPRPGYDLRHFAESAAWCSRSSVVSSPAADLSVRESATMIVADRNLRDIRQPRWGVQLTIEVLAPTFDPAADDCTRVAIADSDVCYPRIRWRRVTDTLEPP